MTSARDTGSTADQLLDAHVRFVLDELSDERLPELAGQVVDELLGIAGRVVLADAVDAARVRAVVRNVADLVVGSPLVEDLVEQIADALFGLGASDEHRLGDVVARERVDALVAKLLSMRTMQDRALDRIAESPAVAAVASRFVSKIIADVIAQNRAMAQKVPGMSSLLSLGTSAAGMVKNPLDQLLGDAAGRSASFALRRTNSATRELMADAPLHEAAMEVWDLHAVETVGDLRAYLEDQDLRELAALVHAIVRDVRTTPYAGEVLDAAVDVVFARYGQWDLASLLAEAGVGRDDLVTDVIALAGPALTAARADGALEDFVRSRLEPFYRSPQVTAILAGRPRPGA